MPPDRSLPGGGPPGGIITSPDSSLASPSVSILTESLAMAQLLPTNLWRIDDRTICRPPMGAGWDRSLSRCARTGNASIARVAIGFASPSVLFHPVIRRRLEVVMTHGPHSRRGCKLVCVLYGRVRKCGNDRLWKNHPPRVSRRTHARGASSPVQPLRSSISGFTQKVSGSGTVSDWSQADPCRSH